MKFLFLVKWFRFPFSNNVSKKCCKCLQTTLQLFRAYNCRPSLMRFVWCNTIIKGFTFVLTPKDMQPYQLVLSIIQKRPLRAVKQKVVPEELKKNPNCVKEVKQNMKWPVLDSIHLYQKYYNVYNMPTIVYKNNKNNKTFQNKNEYYLLRCNVG